MVIKVRALCLLALPRSLASRTRTLTLAPARRAPCPAALLDRRPAVRQDLGRAHKGAWRALPRRSPASGARSPSPKLTLTPPGSHAPPTRPPARTRATPRLSRSSSGGSGSRGTAESQSGGRPSEAEAGARLPPLLPPLSPLSLSACSSFRVREPRTSPCTSPPLPETPLRFASLARNLDRTHAHRFDRVRAPFRSAAHRIPTRSIRQRHERAREREGESEGGWSFRACAASACWRAWRTAPAACPLRSALRRRTPRGRCCARSRGVSVALSAREWGMGREGRGRTSARGRGGRRG